MRLSRAVAKALIAAALMLLPASAQATTPLPVGTTWLLSGDATFDGDLATPTSGPYTTAEALSGDGRYIAFSSSSDNLHRVTIRAVDAARNAARPRR